MSGHLPIGRHCPFFCCPAHCPAEQPTGLRCPVLQRLTCPWGSIMSGHLRALDTMMPFSTDTLSVGSPAMVQART